MSLPDFSAKLPPPHDEEPAQLRSDILDELQDHLSCAVERERRRLQMSDQPADQASVWTAVIERFGDPSALAGVQAGQGGGDGRLALARGRGGDEEGGTGGHDGVR